MISTIFTVSTFFVLLPLALMSAYIVYQLVDRYIEEQYVRTGLTDLIGWLVMIVASLTNLVLVFMSCIFPWLLLVSIPVLVVPWLFLKR